MCRIWIYGGWDMGRIDGGRHLRYEKAAGAWRRISTRCSWDSEERDGSP